jgi:serine O-acetyltransferase
MPVHDQRFSLRGSLRADILRYRSLTGRTVGGVGLAGWLLLLTPRLLPNLLLRLAHRCTLWRLDPLAQLFSLTAYVLFGIEVAAYCRIGPGLFLPHTQGTVIGAGSIGSNCTIYQGVTIGARELDMDFALDRRPVVGNDVLIGAGAKVLGPIDIGAGARIGSNANVVHSLPPGSLALAPACEVRLGSHTGAAGGA